MLHDNLPPESPGFDDLSSAAPAKPIVLVVDDEPSFLLLVKIALEMHGLEVWPASSGREAIDMFQRCERGVAAVILEVFMLDLDGLQTASALRELNPDVAVGFMTIDHEDFDPGELFRQTGVRIFKKPFRLEELVRLTWEIVDETVKHSPRLGLADARR